MHRIILAAAMPLGLAIAGCANLADQLGMTAEEQCAAAQTVILLAEVNEVAPDTLARAKLNVSVFCPAEPVAE